MGHHSLNIDNYYGKYFTERLFSNEKLFSKYFKNTNWNEFVQEYFNTIKRKFYLKMHTDNLLSNYKNIAELKYRQKLKFKL